MSDRRSLFALSIAAALLMSFASAVSADDVAFPDASGDNAGHVSDDPSTPAAGALDVVSIAHGHRPGDYLEPDILVHRVEMRDSWANSVLEERDGRAVHLDLFFTHPGGNGYVWLGVEEDGSLSAPVRSNDFRTEDTQAGFAHAWRADDRTVVIELTRSQIWPSDPQGLSEYTWFARTWDTGCEADETGHEISPCYDFAPDDRAMHHVLAGSGSTDCADGVDNDGDLAADFGDDPGCSTTRDPFEGLSDADGDCNRSKCGGPSFRLRFGRDGQYRLFRGRVASPLRECLSERLVSLYRVSRGPDERLTRSGVHPNGRWLDFVPERPGRYYVEVRARETRADDGV